MLDFKFVMQILATLMGYVVFTYTFHLWAKDKKEKDQSVPGGQLRRRRTPLKSVGTGPSHNAKNAAIAGSRFQPLVTCGSIEKQASIPWRRFFRLMTASEGR